MDKTGQRSAKSKKKSHIGECALCLQEKELVESHVVPRWFWKVIKEGHGHYKFVDVSKQRAMNAQDDQKSPLMCDSCDRSFSNTERCVKHLFDRWLAYPKPNKNFHVAIEKTVDVPYGAVKLFQLLTIWRMAISQKPLFANVDPPVDLIEALRQMLLRKDPGEPEFLPLVVIVDSSGGMKRSVMAPLWDDDRGFFWFAGGAWILGPLDPTMREGALNKKRGGVLPVGLKSFVKTPQFEALYDLRMKDKNHPVS